MNCFNPVKSRGRLKGVPRKPPLTPEDREAVRALGRALARLRAARGMTQAELAERAGVTKNAVGDYERGRYAPGGVVLVRIARALGAEPWELFGSRDLARELREAAQEVLALLRREREEGQRGWIPVVEPVAAGRPVEPGEEGGERLDLQGYPGRAVACRVAGTSMVGRGILPGDFLIAVPYRDREIPRGGAGIAILRDRSDPQGAVVKEVQVAADGSSCEVREYPDPSGPPRAVQCRPEDLEFLARVVALWRPEVG